MLRRWWFTLVYFSKRQGWARIASIVPFVLLFIPKYRVRYIFSYSVDLFLRLIVIAAHDALVLLLDIVSHSKLFLNLPWYFLCWKNLGLILVLCKNVCEAINVSWEIFVVNLLGKLMIANILILNGQLTIISLMSVFLRIVGHHWFAFLLTLAKNLCNSLKVNHLKLIPKAFVFILIRVLHNLIQSF